MSGTRSEDFCRKLSALRADYTSVVGRPFRHFYCPILFRDEATPLSQAHVINEAFPDSARRWTIQRKDVDGFFGTFFEADFTLIQHRGKRPLQILADKRLARRLSPQVLLKGQEIKHYIPMRSVPDSHTQIIIDLDGQPAARLALKLHPSEALAAIDTDWDVGIKKSDVRLAAIPSLLKAAHLTLFELVGYRYALSAGGRVLGHDVLGKFFLANVGKERSAVLRNADSHFREFVNLVRPILSGPPGLSGTITDGLLYLCTGTPHAWALMVLVRTVAQMHAVLVPVLEDDESAARFFRFLSEPAPRFEARLTHFAGERWEVAKNSKVFAWPPANFD